MGDSRRVRRASGQVTRRPAGSAANSALPASYAEVLNDLKAQVRGAQSQASRSVNRELISLYLRIGKTLSSQAAAAGWGDKVVERLARDLRAAFPSISGFSRTNLFYMRQVYEAWATADESVQQLVGLIPWGITWCC